jgi:hypothetical protein
MMNYDEKLQNKQDVLAVSRAPDTRDIIMAYGSCMCAPLN